MTSPPPTPAESAAPEPAPAATTTPTRRRGSRAAATTVGPSIDPASIAPAIEAILLTSDRPIQPSRLVEALRLGPADAGPKGSTEEQPAAGGEKSPTALAAGAALAAVKSAVGLLNEQYTQSHRSFRIEQVAGGYRVMTLPQFADAVAAFQSARARTALTPATLETLAIIAYKQPITRAQLEAIRGVACGDILRALIDRRLVTIAGRAEELGRPMLYATTKQFLEVFGLSSLKDLPSVEELRARAAEAAAEGG